MWKLIRSNWPIALLALAIGIIAIRDIVRALRPSTDPAATVAIADSSWVAPSLYADHELTGDERAKVIYGEELIAHTSKYFGPQGTVATISNGMNCQNCHLNAGKKNWGNNYSAVYANYPKFRDRSGSIESLYKRVSDCFERSLNGTAPDSNSREYQSMEAYIRWLGKDVPKGGKPTGSGIEKLPFMDRAADPVKGKAVYTSQCQSCHGANGEGQMAFDGSSFDYPPLWGAKSYNDGAGLYRISNLAGYIKSNMPFIIASHALPSLTNEQAWDVAAYINSQPRPSKDLSKDWPDISKKPFDHPFGPYTDAFTESQHKYGPYAPIMAAKEQMAKKK